MGRKIILLIGILILIILPLISSAPPFIQEQTNIDFDDGYILTTSQIYYIQVDKPYQFNFFVYNKSDGTLQDNSSINCTFYLANSSGDVLIFSDVPYFADGHWGIDILAGNFSYIGVYAYGLKCEDGFGGAMTGIWETTYTGKELETSTAILYLSLFVILIGFMLILFFIINKLPDSNERDEEGKILSISYLKYLRTTLWFVEWMLVVTIMYLASNLAFAFAGEELFAKILFALFSISFGITPVIVIVWLIWMFVSFFHDREFQNMLNKGIFPQGRL